MGVASSVLLRYFCTIRFKQLKADLLLAEIYNILSEHKDFILHEMSGNLPFMLDNSQTNDNLQVGNSRDCAACDIGLYGGPDAQFQFVSLSDGNAIDAIPFPLL